jgi:hypothetical protein
MHRPREATQELLIRVREGMTKKVYELGMQAKDDETSIGDKAQQYPKQPVPIKAWTEGPCKIFLFPRYDGEKIDQADLGSR